ncbi:MAG: hypothetical protein ACOXZR_00635 [Bacilli bacterium]|jgi:hypothetical protein
MAKKLIKNIDVVQQYGENKGIVITFANNEEKVYPYQKALLSALEKRDLFPLEKIRFIDQLDLKMETEYGKELDQRQKKLERDKKRSANLPKVIKVVALGTVVVLSVMGVKSCVLDKNNKYNGQDITPPPAITEEYDSSKNGNALVLESLDEVQEALTEKENHFDISDVDVVSKIINDLQNQISKAEGVKVDNSDLLKMTLLANNVNPGEMDIFESMVKPLNAILNINTVAATNHYAGVTNLNEKRIPYDLASIFAKRTDRAYVETFTNKREELLDAIFAGNKEKANQVIADFYLLQCQGLIDEEPIKTKEGDINYRSVGGMARFVVLNTSLTTNAIIGGINPQYSVIYDAVADLKYKEPERYQLKNVTKTLQEMNQAEGTNLLKKLENNSLKDIKEKERS